jgi:hypothetical protein
VTSLHVHQVNAIYTVVWSGPALCVLRTWLSLLVGSCVVPGLHRWTCNCGLVSIYVQLLTA